MSETRSVFAAAPCTLRDGVDAVEKVTGHRLTTERADEPVLSCYSVMGIEIHAREEHGLENDRGIPFERLPVEIEFKRFAGLPEVELLTGLCEALSQVTASLLARTVGCECLVVADAQRVIGRYGPTVGPFTGPPSEPTLR